LLPTAAARNKPGSSNVGFVVDKVALGQIFSEYFGFTCQSSFRQFLHNHHLGWYNRPVVAAVPKVLFHNGIKSTSIHTN
jgi:hypothetical protein